jgi:hypothetical protein
LNPNAEIKVQSKEKLRAYLHALKTTLTDFVRRWNRSGHNDPTRAPNFATDDITLYAFYTLYILNDETCPLLYWGRDIPLQAQVELGTGPATGDHTGRTSIAGSRPVVSLGNTETTTTIHLRLDEPSTSSTTSRESQIHETCQRLGATMNDLKDKIVNHRIPAEHRARADSQYCQLSQNYLDHIEQLNAEVANELQARTSQSPTSD